jgi:hypothetical protein
MIETLNDQPIDALAFCQAVQAVVTDVPGVTECIERHRPNS